MQLAWQLTVASFLLTAVVFGSSFAYIFSFFTYSSSFSPFQLSFFAYSGKVCLRSTSTDCKPRSSTVSKKAPTVSKKGFPKHLFFVTGYTWTAFDDKGVPFLAEDFGLWTQLFKSKCLRERGFWASSQRKPKDTDKNGFDHSPTTPLSQARARGNSEEFQKPQPLLSEKVLQCTSNLYGSTPLICIAVPSWLLSLEERETQQCTSHLFCSTPPICTAVRLPSVRQYASNLHGRTFEKVLGLGSPASS